ncbi:MAG TPA: ABC transporter ATP-binding protein [Candidatus Lokiarchaeia archaeon]|nr:ABC transporter ATP-binding protein [Candidatus Lokiarchaeia archaeon]
MALYELTNVSYSYAGQIEALRDVSIAIEAGEQVAILGANGSGKSTLLKLMAGLIFPSNGMITAFGQVLTKKSLTISKHNAFAQDFRQKVGILFQDADAQLFCPTVFDEIAFGPLQLNLPGDEVERRVEEVMETLEITNLRDRAPHALSGGEKKRVAIASILPVNPEVLLLDEPTAGLDPRTQSWLEDFLHTVAQAGKTIILATHDLDIADATCEHSVVFNEDHQISATGTTHDIMENRELLLQVNLVHEHYHHHGETWHKHGEAWHEHSHEQDHE